MSDTDKHEAKKLVVIALGKLIGREYRIDGWLERLVREFEEELRKAGSDCKIVLYGATFSVDRGRVDHIHFAEIVVRCDKQEPIFARIYVDPVKYLRVADTEVE
jgi:hypothetical protein